MSRRNLTVLFLAIVAALLCGSRVERNPYARYVSEGFTMIDEWGLDEPRDHELMAGAVAGMVDVLRRRGDEHSAFVEPEIAEPLLAEMAQEFGGVGVRIKLHGDPQRLTVVESPVPGSPAYRSLVRRGDRIVAIDGAPTLGMSMIDVLDRMRGVPGEPVVLTIERDDVDELIAVKLVREVIELPSVAGDQRLPSGEWVYRLEGEPSIALVRIVSFGAKTVAELRTVLSDLTKRSDGEPEISGVVLDLRHNAGGAIDAAVGVCELLLENGAPIVTTRGRDRQVEDAYAARGDGPFTDLPIVVLIDRNTASASEIVAASLQDNGRARVVGERSYGKGTVQRLLSLESGRSLLKLTSASYWRPSGVNIHRAVGQGEDEPWGVKPDAEGAIEQTPEEMIAWFEWRQRRDLIAEAEPAEQATQEATQEAALEEDEETPQEQASDQTESPASLARDPALARAVELLLAPGADNSSPSPAE
ncbi:putative CtpA-like serine protease [Pseudobythopirellula maris]|uniref:Putative CtpA-like serine protease n=1 Tax=Pseudobythopirellula maris TaxID=2527991 RepID=A0A5C5ZMF9_9BACT|nr:S41 family peptidase [Pseudobythopirellula maris]TWT88642.1 putative CtpA-like serine protease [Pseudobythopirellula maris]